jgi:hypothetical protein
VNGDDAVEVIIGEDQDDLEHIVGWYRKHGWNGNNKPGVSKNISFKYPGYYKIIYRHEEGYGEDNYELLWKKPGDSSYTIVPKDNLFYCEYNPVFEYRMDECKWSGTKGEIKDRASGYNATAFNGANTEDNATAGGGICKVADLGDENSKGYIKVDNPDPSYINGEGDMSLSFWVKVKSFFFWESVFSYGNMEIMFEGNNKLSVNYHENQGRAVLNYTFNKNDGIILL